MNPKAVISRWLTLLGVLTLAVFPAAAQGQWWGTINASNANTITLTLYNGPAVVVVPTNFAGYTVTGLSGSNPTGSYWVSVFASSDIPVVSVQIPDSVTSIGEATFYSCTSLSNVDIPNSVTTIGDAAFSGCTSLSSVNIPNSVTALGGYVFESCSSLTNVVITDGSGIRSLGTEEFYGCSHLTNFTIPNSITSLGSFAFSGTGLANIMIPSSVTNIGSGPFEGCMSLEAITVDPLNPAYASGGGVLFNKNRTFLLQYPSGLHGSYRIPSEVSSIGTYAFGSSSLTSVTLPTGLTSIADYAFAFASDLTEVIFTGNAPFVDSTGFYNDANATIYYLDGTSGWAGLSATTGLPAVLWNPLIQTSRGSVGFSNNTFGFNITGAYNLIVAVEACTNLAAPSWTTIQTVTLTNGLYHFSDPQWPNYPARFYGLGFP